MPMGGPTQTKHWFYSRWFLIGGSVVFVLLIIGFGRAWVSQHQIRQEIDRLQSETARLETKRLETLEALHYTQSSTFIEQKARTELNLVKPGEQVAVVATTEKSGAQAGAGQPDSGVVQSADISNLYKWWQYFFSQ